MTGSTNGVPVMLDPMLETQGLMIVSRTTIAHRGVYHGRVFFYRKP